MKYDTEVIMLTRRPLLIALACFPFLPKNVYTNTIKPKSKGLDLMLKASSQHQVSTDVANKKTRAFKLTYDKTSNSWITQSGLKYGQGSKQGNYVKHVLEYAVSNSDKKPHLSVFNVIRKEILKLLDEAWLAKGSPLQGSPGVYIVPMKRAIGTAGETRIEISVRPSTNEIITAKPLS